MNFNTTRLLQAFIILYCTFGHCYAGLLPPSQQFEQALITSLLSGYNKNIRPDGKVDVGITASILQIVSIDEKQQIMTSSLYISQLWNDDRLSWDTSVINQNITFLMLPVKSIWIPDTMILNSADTSGYFSINDYSLASVYNDGTVYMILPALTIKTRCNFNVRKFPFDRQMCTINLTSWSQDVTRITYSENNTDVVDTSKYVQHPLWKLDDTNVVVLNDGDRVIFEDSYNSIISIQLYLRRKSLFFIVNGIFACLVLNCVTLLSYALPFGSQVGLCMTCFMTYSVYSLNFSNLFPQQSEYLMMITTYFLLSISWTLLSMLWFVVCNHYMTKSEMPKFLENFCAFLQKCLFCCFPPNKDEKKKDISTEGGDHTKQSTNLSTAGATKDEVANCICCQEISGSCYLRKSAVANGTKQNVINAVQIAKSELQDSSPTKAATSISNQEAGVPDKRKCNFCRRCESCQADFDKDKGKGKKKKDIESKCSALNYFIFFWIFLFMLISNLALWLVMSQS